MIIQFGTGRFEQFALERWKPGDSFEFNIQWVPVLGTTIGKSTSTFFRSDIWNMHVITHHPSSSASTFYSCWYKKYLDRLCSVSGCTFLWQRMLKWASRLSDNGINPSSLCMSAIWVLLLARSMVLHPIFWTNCNLFSVSLLPVI